VKPGAGGEIQLTDALAVLAQQGRLIGVRFKGSGTTPAIASDT